MKRVMIAVLACVALSACSDAPRAKKALDDLGFTDIKVGGYKPFMCGKEYTFSTSFTAKNTNGMPVSGAVCSGLFVGANVHFD